MRKVHKQIGLLKFGWHFLLSCTTVNRGSFGAEQRDYQITVVSGPFQIFSEIIVLMEDKMKHLSYTELRRFILSPSRPYESCSQQDFQPTRCAVASCHIMCYMPLAKHTVDHERGGGDAGGGSKSHDNVSHRLDECSSKGQAVKWGANDIFCGGTLSRD